MQIHLHSIVPLNTYPLTFSRGLWTWPPWVICAPAFNHKIGNAAHSGVSEDLFFTKSYKWKKRRWEKLTTGRLLLEIMCFWRPPMVRQFQDGWPRMRAQQKFKPLDVAWQCPDYSLLFPCRISFAESFVACLRNKAYVYLLTLLTYLTTLTIDSSTPGLFLLLNKAFSLCDRQDDYLIREWTNQGWGLS